MKAIISDSKKSVFAIPHNIAVLLMADYYSSSSSCMNTGLVFVDGNVCFTFNSKNMEWKVSGLNKNFGLILIKSLFCAILYRYNQYFK